MQHVFTVIDVNDMEAMTGFWSALTGLEAVGEAPGYRWLAPQVEGAPMIAFQLVDDPKSGKNRVHLDLHSDDVLGQVERAKALGASEGERFGWPTYHWVVMHDPEGNEFCLAGSGPAPWEDGPRGVE